MKKILTLILPPALFYLVFLISFIPFSILFNPIYPTMAGFMILIPLFLFYLKKFNPSQKLIWIKKIRWIIMIILLVSIILGIYWISSAKKNWTQISLGYRICFISLIWAGWMLLYYKSYEILLKKHLKS